MALEVVTIMKKIVGKERSVGTEVWGKSAYGTGEVIRQVSLGSGMLGKLTH